MLPQSELRQTGTIPPQEEQGLAAGRNIEDNLGVHMYSPGENEVHENYSLVGGNYSDGVLAPEYNLSFPYGPHTLDYPQLEDSYSWVTDDILKVIKNNFYMHRHTPTAILIALFLQAIFFQFGGLVVLGVNTVTMAVPALCCYYLALPWLKNPKTMPVAAFGAGALAIFLSSLLMALALALSDSGFLTTAKVIIGANVPIMIIEGFITMFTVTFLARVQPEILHLDQP